jgi:hypothetical protein
LTAAQRAVWANVMADAPGGLLCRIDTDTLAHFVVMLQAQHDNARRFNASGADPGSKAGAAALRAMKVLSPHIKAWCIEFGFTPAARARLGAAGAAMANATRTPTAPVDPLQRFLGNGQ